MSNLKASLLAAVVFLVVGYGQAVAQDLQARCIVVDSDAGLDDMRAIAALVSTGQIAAIVVTEGIARTEQGAGAIEELLKRGGISLPVVPGRSPSLARTHEEQPNLAAWRANAERLDGLLPEPVKPTNSVPDDIGAKLVELTRHCRHVSLIVIGPWTNFMFYGPLLLEKIDRVIVQGRPDPDEIEGEPSGFNCTYDLESCLAAFDMLAGRRLRRDRRLKAVWVDIPHSPEGCGMAEPGVAPTGERVFAFSPTVSWYADLESAGGMGPVIADLLKANPDGWSKTSLWDDLTVLYVRRPDLFKAGGGHLEPCIPAETARKLLARYMGGN